MIVGTPGYVSCMGAPSPYRSLPLERRLALVTHVIASGREGRTQFIERLVSRGGGFRAVTLNTWPPGRLAAEIVRMKAESAHDELQLLQLLYVELEPAMQITFLDAAGVAHEHGKIAEELPVPYADEAAVRRAASAVVQQHGPDGARYLRTLERYSREGWPGIEGAVAALDDHSPDGIPRDVGGSG